MSESTVLLPRALFSVPIQIYWKWRPRDSSRPERRGRRREYQQRRPPGTGCRSPRASALLHENFPPAGVVSAAHRARFGQTPSLRRGPKTFLLGALCGRREAARGETMPALPALPQPCPDPRPRRLPRTPDQHTCADACGEVHPRALELRAGRGSLPPAAPACPACSPPSAPASALAPSASPASSATEGNGTPT